MERNIVERAVKRIKGELGWFISEDINFNVPPRESEPATVSSRNLFAVMQS